MRTSFAVLLSSTAALAQPPPPQTYPQQPYPYGAPYGYPPQYQYPPGYPASPEPPETPLSFTLTTRDDGARVDALACVEAIEDRHLDVARRRCTEAIAKDEQFALAHFWLSLAADTPSTAREELAKAVRAAAQVSPGERLMIDGWRAWRNAQLDEARRAYEELCRLYPSEKRAFVQRGLFRQVALGELEGAIGDYRKALALDDHYAAGQNYLGFALAAQGKLDEAQTALKRYTELAPTEPNAFDSLARLALEMGKLEQAATDARKALALDGKFLTAHAVLGDALLFSGKGKEARREYAALHEASDPALRHDGAMREARSFLFEERFLEAEKGLIKEAAVSSKAGRAVDAAAAFLEAARSQVERSALGEAGRGIKEASELLANLDAWDLRQLQANVAEMRALALASLNERELAETRAEEMRRQEVLPGGEARAKAVRGWIAYRVGDDKAAFAGLEHAVLPTLRYAYALALARNGDTARARTLMEALARRTNNDVATGLARPRAAAWLKSNALLQK